MIISLRGTNGAGKSTIVRALMNCYAERTPIMIERRRKPLGYKLFDPKIRQLFIPGHYEITNGGVDTLDSLDTAYDLVEMFAQEYNVIFEGKNLSDSPKRVLDRFTNEQIQIVYVDHPVDECIASVRARGHKIKESTIRSIADRSAKHAEQFMAAGYSVHVLSRKDALSACKSILGIDAR